ncbi:MAG: PmoA family protein [Rubripirellula sp.]|nr:PmoA family protein [Rubripirellula sp.]
MIRTLLGLVFLSIGVPNDAVSGDPPSTPLTASVDPQGVLVRQGSKPVLFFQRELRSKSGRWSRANYIHPLYDIEGSQVISEDFPADHGHHRGVFWAWHQVCVNGKKLGDSWLCEDFVWDVRSVEFESPASPLRLKTLTHWKSPDLLDEREEMISVVEERVVISVHAEQDKSRVIDFEIALLALVPGVEIGGSEDRKGYGGFSPRLRLSPDQSFMAAAGVVEPQVTAVDVGNWVELVGDSFRVKMMADPSNPPPVGLPTPTHWILRQKRSMQNAVFPGRELVTLSTEAPTVLRYRLLIR